MYHDRAIFSKDVTFMLDREIKANVLTCAAPNWSIGLNYGKISKAENSKALKERIAFIFDIMEEEGVRVAILGAFSCGVFRQDAEEVARIMREESKKSSITRIVYAVPEGIHKENHEAFMEMIYFQRDLRSKEDYLRLKDEYYSKRE